MKRIARPFELKDMSESGTFSGYGAVFGNMDSWRDIIAPGAFKRTLAEHDRRGTLPAMLWQHNPDEPIGVYTSMKEDTTGLYVEGKLILKTQRGAEAYALLAEKALRGLSIGYRTVTAKWDEKTLTRTLLDVELFEVSPVTFPANEEATVDAVKAAKAAMTSPRDFERFLRDAGLSRSEAKKLMAKGFNEMLVQRDADEDEAEQAQRDAGGEAEKKESEKAFWAALGSFAERIVTGT